MSNEQQNASPVEQTQQEKRGGNLLSWINLILIVILFVLAGFAGWLAWQQHNKVTADAAVLENNLAMALAGIEASNVRENELMARAEALNAASETLAEQVAHNAERLGKLPGAERQDWLLAEAEYLLRLANQRLELERDWDGAVSMLVAADNVLVETRNPAMNKVRALIARELMALRAVPAIDTVGAVFRIQALQETVVTLPWMPEKLIEEPVADEEPRTLEDQTWYWDLWYAAKTQVQRMVRIRDRAKPIEAPLTPDQQYYLQQNMLLMLEQAQVALLREETELYQHSIKRVQSWLDQYLIIEDERTRAAYAALAELSVWDVAPERPDISASLVMLRKLVEEQRRGTVSPSTPVSEPAPAAESAEGEE